MISEDELAELLHKTADVIDVPLSGPARIRAAAVDGAPRSAKRRFEPLRRREVAFAGTGIAAVAALIAVLLTAGGAAVPTVARPVPFSTGTPANGVASSHGAAQFQRSVPSLAPNKTLAKRAGGKSAGRDIIATGALHLSVGANSLVGAVDRLENIALSYGGYVGSSNVVESGPHAGGTLVLDVPAVSFQAVIAKARHSGTVHSLVTSDQDVTGQVTDLGARITALVDERNQLEVLLSKSAKVSDLLAVENEIAFVQSEIEQLQGQQRVLSKQVAFSALTVQLSVPRKHHHLVASGGFGHAWHVALSNFVDAVKSFVSVLGDLAFAVLAALAALVVSWISWRRAWPRVRRRFV